MYNLNDFPQWRNQVNDCARILVQLGLDNPTFDDIIKHLRGFNWLSYKAERFAAMVLNYSRNGRPLQWFDAYFEDEE